MRVTNACTYLLTYVGSSFSDSSQLSYLLNGYETNQIVELEHLSIANGPCSVSGSILRSVSFVASLGMTEADAHGASHDQGNE